MEPVSIEVDRLAQAMILRRRRCSRSSFKCETRCLERCYFGRAAREERRQQRLLRIGQLPVLPPPRKFSLEQLRRSNNQNHRRAESWGCEHTATLADILEMYAGDVRCRYCGIHESETMIIIDHFVPLCRLGGHVRSNLVLSCCRCNILKGSMMPDVFLSRLQKGSSGTVWPASL